MNMGSQIPSSGQSVSFFAALILLTVSGYGFGKIVIGNDQGLFIHGKNKVQPVGWAHFLCPSSEDMLGTAQLYAGQIYNFWQWIWGLTSRNNSIRKRTLSRSGGIGRRRGLKILRAQALASSSLASGTTNIKAFSVSAGSLFILDLGHCARNCAQLVFQIIFLFFGRYHQIIFTDNVVTLKNSSGFMT